MSDLEATVERCRAGDEQAWNTLVDETVGPIYRLCVSYAPTSAEAEELAQDVYVKIWQNLHQYRPSSSFTAWAWRVARNLLTDAFRRSRRERQQAWLDAEVLERLPAADDPQTAAERKQRLRLVEQGLRRIGDELAELVLMRDFVGLSYQEIADSLELPLGTVKSRLNRARLELADEVRRRINLRAVPNERPTRTLSGGAE